MALALPPAVSVAAADDEAGDDSDVLPDEQALSTDVRMVAVAAAFAHQRMFCCMWNFPLGLNGIAIDSRHSVTE